MEYNSRVSIILPDSIGQMENDFEDHEDIVREQTNRNEIVELIMAAFEGHDEPSDDDDDDESLNTSGSSHHSSDEQQILNMNSNNNTDEHYVQQQNELLHRTHPHQQVLFSTPSIPTPSIDINGFEITDNDYTRSQYVEHNNNEEELPFNTKNHLAFYQTPNHASTPPIDITDPTQGQYHYQTSTTNLNDAQNQINKFRILCNAKDRKVFQLQNLCEEYQVKYERDMQTLQYKVDDLEERHELINTQCEELVDKNNQLHKTIKDSELRIQQLESFEKKVSDSELLIDSLHQKINELQQFESIAHSQQDYELILYTTREKHEHERISLSEKLENSQMNLQEKDNQADELRRQLEIANKNNENALYERMETISHLNVELHDYQQKYSDLLAKTSLESFNQTEIKRELTLITEEKEKLEHTCQELQSEIRTLREHEVNNAKISIKNYEKSSFNDNIRLKERIDEYILNEKQLIQLNTELQRKIVDYEYKSQRSDSDSSSSSSSSGKTVITTSAHTEQIRNLTNQIEKLKKDLADLEEKYDYEKHELQTMIEQLREDVIDLDKTKQLYIDVCQEKNSIEDTLRSKFEFELKTKIDDLYRILEKDYNEKILSFKNNANKTQHLEQQSNEFHHEIERIKIKYEKQITELNYEIERLRNNDHAKNRLVLIEKEYDQLKHDYYNLTIKQKESVHTYSTLENENRNLLNSIEQIEHEKFQLKQIFENEKEKLLHEIKQLHEHQKREVISAHKQTDYDQKHLKQHIESLELRINNYENAISQYEEYRIKLEANLQKLTQQRDTNKVDLRLTQELLTNKDEEYNQLRLRVDEYEKHIQMNKERFVSYETTINDLQRQVQELNQTRSIITQETELQFREKLISLETEKCQFEQRLQEANRALGLADSHLKQEIEKIKIGLEQEYNRRYERDHKQHQQDLHQLRQHLTNEIERPRISISPVNLSNTSLQDTEDIKKMYRAEIDRLYRENIELSQHQSKLIDTHQKQMQIMKKELDEGYNNLINEFQREQTRLQTRYDQLKQQLTSAQHTIDLLKSNLTQLKTNHFDDITKVKEAYTIEYDHKNRRDNLQQRLENLVKLLEQSNDALIQERTLHAHQENEYQKTITSLQKKIADMIKQHTKTIDETKREIQYERSTNQKRILTSRPNSVPEFVHTELTSTNLATIEKLRELFTIEMLALLRLTCKMIFDVHQRVTMAQYMDTVEISIKKQIQNELIRSRNSMIKDFRREIFEKITHAFRSQGVPDTTIDMHIFELDRLLSQMAQDCLDSLTTSSQVSSNSSVLSFQMTPQNLSSPNKSTIPLRKSIECLYMTPIANKKLASLAPHCRSTLDISRRPKSASHVLITSQNSSPSGITSPYTHRFQRSTHRNFRMKMCRSEDDIMLALQRHEQEKMHSDDDTDDTLTIYENEDELPNPINNNQQEENDDNNKLTCRPQRSSPIPPTQKNGIKKFVRNSLKLFITPSPQQHKRTGK